MCRQAPVGSIKDPASGEQVEKHVFVVFYAGERARTKVLKVSVARRRRVTQARRDGVAHQGEVTIRAHSA